MMTPAEAAAATRQHIWQHFIHCDTQMFYDFDWRLHGRYLPTPEEIARSFPTRAGGRTGMENPALNAGQYLPAVVLRHQLSHDAASTDEARLLFSGMKRLCDVAKDPGFLPRGVALDGASHYTNSSVDQINMFLNGIFRYYESDIPTEEEKQAIRQIWQNMLARWERDGWEDRTEDGQPAVNGDIGAIADDRASRLLMALLGGAVVTGDEHWRRQYRQKLEEQDYARLKTGLPPSGGALYVLDQNQVAWRLLADLEDDPAIRQEYQARLAETAAAVHGNLLAYQEFDPAEHSQRKAASDWDWRKAHEPPDQTQTTPSLVSGKLRYASVEQARERRLRLRKLQPVWWYEFQYVTEPFEAAHVLLLSGDAVSLDLLQSHLGPLFGAYPYEQLALSWSLYDTECDYWLAVQAGLL